MFEYPIRKLVGTGSIKISRTVLPGWGPEQNKYQN